MSSGTDSLTPFTIGDIAVMAATIAYGTPVTPMMMAGGVLTLIGVAIITLRTAKKSVEPEAR